MNLALTGFMGTGKSSVGRLLAQRLAHTHLDTDAWIEGQAQMSIPALFAAEGEAAFRAREYTLIVSLEQQKNLVISTGGGLIVDPRNRHSLRRHARLLCLTARPETIVQRVEHQQHRPLLQGHDPLARIQQLLHARAQAYADAEVQVATDEKTVEEVVEEILDWWRR